MADSAVRTIAMSSVHAGPVLEIYRLGIDEGTRHSK